MGLVSVFMEIESNLIGGNGFIGKVKVHIKGERNKLKMPGLFRSIMYM